MIDHMMVRWLLPVGLKSSQRHMYALNGLTWIPKWSLLSSAFISDLIQVLTAFFHDFSWFLGFQKLFMVPADYENQLFMHDANICSQNNQDFWIRNVRIDNVPKYLCRISPLSPNFYPYKTVDRNCNSMHKINTRNIIIVYFQ